MFRILITALVLLLLTTPAFAQAGGALAAATSGPLPRLVLLALLVLVLGRDRPRFV
jgi:hypothetical protein